LRENPKVQREEAGRAREVPWRPYLFLSAPSRETGRAMQPEAEILIRRRVHTVSRKDAKTQMSRKAALPLARGPFWVSRKGRDGTDKVAKNS
jgi:hypothetical protein